MLKRVPIFYMDKKTLLELNRNSKIHDYKRLGIVLINKITLSDILFKKVIKKRGKNGFFVDESTYKESNVPFIKTFISYIDISLQLGRSDKTITNKILCIKRFFKYINENDLFEIKNKENAQKVYQSYSLFLRQELRIGNISNNTAQNLQYRALEFLEFHFDDDKSFIGSDIALIKTSKNLLGNTSARDKKDISYAFNFYLKMFDQITNFLTGHNKYPYKINVSNRDMYILPYRNMKKIFVTKSSANQFFDFEKGRLKDKIEFKSHPNRRIKERLKYHKDIFDNNNLREDTQVRMELGEMALKCYFMHFLSVTGMNDSVASTIIWTDDFRKNKGSQSFKNIKCRANNKVVEFEIQKIFHKYFKKFIVLRDFLLDGNESEYLFFEGHQEKTKLSKRQITGSFSSGITRKFSLIDPCLPRINSRELRVYKTNYNIKKHGIVIASQIAQNSISTILRHYTGENSESTSSEITDYFESLNILEDNTISKGVKTPIGSCNDYNNPKTEAGLDNIKSNCVQSEGCLFCEKYRIHADNEDIRKLFSLLYIINETRFVTPSQEYFDKTYLIVIERIKNILSFISSHRGQNAVKLIENDVMENQNLHPYWENKLEMLIDVGILK